MLENGPHGLLKVLRRKGVNFVVVGEFAAALHAVPVSTMVVDVVHARDPENVSRIIGLLDDIDAIYRIQPARKLKPTASHLSSAGHQNLTTRYGPFDLLGTIGEDLSYEDLLPLSDEIDIGEGLRIRVLNLETLIAIKEKLGGDKDRAVLPILRQTLAERRKQETSGE
jgi:hypothetical protein